ncbi:Homeobox-leucine zipper family protein / lipid-binding START domain-containing protein [Perilla frutescens var. hirtella]|uniref:Homeobox-leucine zipper family protein / lipid-binding START domain-containing protein n=1 Tax=Perilla frutescens var. hirtella TaxID=608512 RepID=A0AAD4ILY0_PERFH|nr:Homeobox-leucine zipper family protein / lipid-binding START domain-containing protein [Perilla frutescens var. hirtella]
MEAELNGQVAEQRRLPLSEVVSDCVNRWFQDTLKEAKTGDINMQMLVGQMYYCGYGISKDANKVIMQVILIHMIIDSVCYGSLLFIWSLGVDLLSEPSIQTKMVMVAQHRSENSSGSISKHLDSSKYVRYMAEQVEALDRVYTECPKPSSLRRQQLIRECPILSNIEPRQIKVWFQNRR